MHKAAHDCKRRGSWRAASAIRIRERKSKREELRDYRRFGEENDGKGVGGTGVDMRNQMFESAAQGCRKNLSL
jgi:hypothetical protein